MSLWIAGATLAASIGGKVAQGYAASKVDTSGQVGAAKEVSFAEKQQQQGENKAVFDKLDFKSDNLINKLTTDSQRSMYDIFKAGQTAASTSGFASSDATNVEIDRAKSNSYTDLTTGVKNIMEETRLNKKSITLNNQKATADIEKRLSSNITQATSQADTFWEGVAGGGDYEIN
jgi:hypothetical protein